MSAIENVDKNLCVKINIDKTDIKFYNIDDKPFNLYGIFKDKDIYRRIPLDVAKCTSKSVEVLHTNTAGGRLRFKTDSSYIAINAKMSGISKFPHCAISGTAGFDLYADGHYAATFTPPFDIIDGYESIYEFDTRKTREITINFPTYSNVNSLYIGLENTAHLTSSADYINDKPIVYYGSSITQGGCASRPGNTYQNIISNELNVDYLNLGFSGSALAEETIYKYIATLPMSAFVFDYDHNAPTVEHLKNTHQKMFNHIRSLQPKLPIIIMSGPSMWLSSDEIEKRKSIIFNTYKEANQSGDRNVYFIDGQHIFNSVNSNIMTVDRIHPNDFGFWCMAKELLPVLKAVFE